jgi:glutaredoxin
MILRAFSLVTLVALTVLAASGPVVAQQYRWVDRNGNVQFSDTPPPAGAKDVRKVDSATPPSAAPAPAAAPVPFELARLQADFPVTLYTSPTCKEGCALAREALNKRGVPFKEVQVWNPDTNEELKRASGGLDVPTLLVGRSAQRGFEQGAFDALLDSAGYPRAGLLPPQSQKAPVTPEGYVAPNAPKPVAQPINPAESAQKSGPYDTSGLQGPAPKPGIYDPSGLTGPAPKPGPYGVPGETK